MVSFRRFNPASAGDFDDHMLDLSAPNGVVRPLTVDKDTTTKQRFSKAKRFLVKSKLGCAVLNILCILVILFGHGVSIGPGIYAIFIHKPEIVIDKSIQAFNIPSHQAIKHQDALELAIADSKKIHKRGKRSIEQRDEVNEKADFHHQLKRALTEDFQNETLSSSAGPDIRSEKFLSDNIFGNIKEGVDVMESYGSYDNGVFGLENGNDVHSSNELPSSDRRASNDIFANKLHQFKPSDTRDNEPKQEMSESDYNDDVVNMQELLHVQEPLMNADAWYKSQRELTKRRSKRSTNRYDNTFRQDPQSLLYWRITLVYLAKGEDQNIFTPERLKRIHEIETMITRHPNYTDFCYKNRGLASRNKNVQNMIDGCAPINSLMTYFFPSYTDGVLKYDGLGTTLQDVNKTLLLAMNKETFFWYVDEKVTSSHLKSRLLRSEIHFGSPLKGFHNYRDRRRDQSHKFVEFAKSFVDMLSKASDRFHDPAIGTFTHLGLAGAVVTSLVDTRI